MREDITASDITISTANVEDTNSAGKRSEKLTRKTTAIPSENNSETRSEDNSGKKEKTVGEKSTVKTIEKNSVNGTEKGDLRAKKETAIHSGGDVWQFFYLYSIYFCVSGMSGVR